MALIDADGKLAAYYQYAAWGNTMTEAEASGVENPVGDPAEGGNYSTKGWRVRGCLRHPYTR